MPLHSAFGSICKIQKKTAQLTLSTRLISHCKRLPLSIGRGTISNRQLMLSCIIILSIVFPYFLFFRQPCTLSIYTLFAYCLRAYFRTLIFFLARNILKNDKLDTQWVGLPEISRVSQLLYKPSQHCSTSLSF